MELKEGYTLLLLVSVVVGAIGSIGKFKFQTKKGCHDVTEDQNVQFCSKIDDIKKIINEGNTARDRAIEKKDEMDRKVLLFMGRVAENLEITLD